jgi:uncharacterized membrane protein
MTAPADRRVAVLIGILGGSALLHFALPRPYEKIVPPQLGDARTLVYASGVAELICAGMLAAPRSRRLGGLASAALFVGVFPANIYAVKVMGGTRIGRAAAIARLPLQWPLITSALQVARES